MPKIRRKKRADGVRRRKSRYTRRARAPAATVEDVATIVNNQTALLNPAAAAVNAQTERVIGALGDETKTNTQKMRSRMDEIRKLAQLRQLHPAQHSMASRQPQGLPDPVHVPTPPSERALNAPEEPPPPGEEVWTKRSTEEDVLDQVFLDKVVHGINNDDFVATAYTIYNKYFKPNIERNFDGFLLEGKQIIPNHFRAFIQFLMNEKGESVFNTTLTNRKLLDVLVQRIRRDTKNMFREAIAKPTKAEMAVLSDWYKSTFGTDEPVDTKALEDFILLDRVRKVILKKPKDGAPGMASRLLNTMTLGYLGRGGGAKDNLQPDVIAQAAPKSQYVKARHLLEEMAKDDDFGWNEKGELVKGDNTLENSSVRRVVSYMFASPDERFTMNKPKGTDTFALEMMQKANLLQRKGVDIKKNRWGMAVVTRLSVDVLDVSFKLAYMLSAFNIPWYVWLSGLMAMNVTDFKTYTDYIQHAPKVILGNNRVSQAAGTVIDTTGQIADSLTTPETRAAIIPIMQYAKQNPSFATTILGYLSQGAYALAFGATAVLAKTLGRFTSRT